jgi:competence protein ComEA
MKFAALPLLAALILASCRGEISSNANLTKSPPQNTASQPCVNINTATVEELTRLPAIGEVIAQRIVEHRAHNGPFRRKQDIIIIDGVSEKKYRAIADFICVE